MISNVSIFLVVDVPSMKEENILKNGIPILQWVAVKVIEKDTKT